MPQRCGQILRQDVQNLIRSPEEDWVRVSGRDLNAAPGQCSIVFYNAVLPRDALVVTLREKVKEPPVNVQENRGND